MPSYTPTYYLAVLNAIIGVVAGVLASAFLTVHPSWLTSDVAATGGIVVLISGGLAASVLPPLTRTPGSREAKYLSASVGVLPADLAAAHPEVLTPPTTPAP